MVGPPVSTGQSLLIKTVRLAKITRRNNRRNNRRNYSGQRRLLGNPDQSSPMADWLIRKNIFDYFAELFPQTISLTLQSICTNPCLIDARGKLTSERGASFGGLNYLSGYWWNRRSGTTPKDPIAAPYIPTLWTLSYGLRDTKYTLCTSPNKSIIESIAAGPGHWQVKAIRNWFNQMREQGIDFLIHNLFGKPFFNVRRAQKEAIVCDQASLWISVMAEIEPDWNTNMEPAETGSLL